MSAGHDHAHGITGQRGLLTALALTVNILFAEVAGAVLTNSLALLSDAAHMLAGVTALVFARIAIRLGRRPADRRRTYGYDRFEILAAAVNAVALFFAAISILGEAAQRFQQPKEIASTGMLIVAAFGLAANLVSMRVLHAHAESSLNLKRAYLEVWSDALGSVGVILAAAVIHLTLDSSATDPQTILNHAREAIEAFGITHSIVQIETATCHPDPHCTGFTHRH